MVDDGTIIFNGQVFLAQGTKICVDLGGELEFGNHVSCTGNSEIICNKRIYIGNNALLSWNVMLMDTDGHIICDRVGQEQEQRKAIHIGDRTWIGCRVSVLKGSYLPDGCIVAGGTIVTCKFDEPHSIIAGGTRPTIIAHDKYWR